MKKEKAIKCDLNTSEVKRYINLCKESKLPYEVQLSTYSTRLRSDIINVDFLKNAHSNRMFSGYAKIKKDILQQESNGRRLSPFNRSYIMYFRANIKEDMHYEKIHHIDLNSAYLQALYNDNWISEETFEYCNNLPKQERLASVGMLASNKDIFYYNEDGNMEAYAEEKNPLSDYFFWASQKVGEVLKELSILLESNFLFFWVDGIYFRDLDFISSDNYNMSEQLNKFTPIYINNYLNDLGYKSKYESFTNFKAIKENKTITLTYDVNSFKSKKYQIPLVNEEQLMKKEIMQFLKLD